MDSDRSWEERQLTEIITRAAESAIDSAIMYRQARRIVPELRDLGRYLLDAMDWFTATRASLVEAWDPDPVEPLDAFEAWLIERWLKDIRSDEFRDSVQGQRLMAEWERNG